MQVEAIEELYDYNYRATQKLLQAVEGLSQAQLHADLLNGIGSMHKNDATSDQSPDPTAQRNRHAPNGARTFSRGTGDERLF